MNMARFARAVARKFGVAGQMDTWVSTDFNSRTNTTTVRREPLWEDVAYSRCMKWTRHQHGRGGTLVVRRGTWSGEQAKPRDGQQGEPVARTVAEGDDREKLMLWIRGIFS